MRPDQTPTKLNARSAAETPSRKIHRLGYMCVPGEELVEEREGEREVLLTVARII